MQTGRTISLGQAVLKIKSKASCSLEDSRFWNRYLEYPCEVQGFHFPLDSLCDRPHPQSYRYGHESSVTCVHARRICRSEVAASFLVCVSGTCYLSSENITYNRGSWILVRYFYRFFTFQVLTSCWVWMKDGGKILETHVSVLPWISAEFVYELWWRKRIGTKHFDETTYCKGARPIHSHHTHKKVACFLVVDWPGMERGPMGARSQIY